MIKGEKVSRLKLFSSSPGPFSGRHRPFCLLTPKAPPGDLYSLNHITRSRLALPKLPRVDQLSIIRLIASTTHLNSVRVQTLVTSQVVKEHQQDLNVLSVLIFLCAQYLR